MARPFLRKLTNTALAAVLSVTTTGTAVGAMTVFDPTVFAEVAKNVTAAQQMLKTAKETYSSIAGIYSEITGYINLAENIVNQPDEFLKSTVTCLFDLNFGSMRTGTKNLCAITRAALADLTVMPDASDPNSYPATVTTHTLNQVQANRNATHQGAALRAASIGAQQRASMPDAAAALRDLQISGSAATTLVPMAQVAMQGILLANEHLAALRAMKAAELELLGVKEVRNTPILFIGLGTATQPYP